ncbi:DUF177 domain-containing protein [Aerophototrophica crusticola]|uniref:DUF177 domain-containing protein n=1 Tax=Aerophototrophica crusticola TaxID=1709002 RepID=A0A858R5A9_9PROT|nr:DUF177 domain-containing protein [Rhodospirillaceae bacterium B3]
MSQPQTVGGSAPEMSRVVIADTVSTGGKSLTIDSKPEERAALAKRFDLVAIDSLTATLRLRRVRGEMVKVTGSLSADVVQTCVVTLDPVPAHVEEEFSALFAPDHLLPKEEEEEEMTFSVEMLEEDVPEAMPGGRIDVGELVAQHLSLALDPYPRKAGISFEEIDEGAEPDSAPVQAEPAKPNPFAALARLKKPS